MTYVETIKASLVILANIIIAVLAVLLAAYIIYRCFPRRIRCKITRWIKSWR